MQNQSQLTPIGVILRQAISNIAHVEAIERSTNQSQTIHVPNVGSEISVAYEQLRNASENIEDHLLFQRAIHRFYKRSIELEDTSKQNVGYELVVELTQSGYLENDSIGLPLTQKIDYLVNEWSDVYRELVSHNKTNNQDALRWILELLSVRTEQLFHHPVRPLSFAYFAHSHFSPIVKVTDSKVEGEKFKKTEHPQMLYIAVHKALLKSDDANIRSALLEVYHVNKSGTAKFSQFNQRYDELTKFKTTANLARLISINGAPLRAVYSTFFKDGANNTLEKQSFVLRAVEMQLDRDYQLTRDNLRKGIRKSIIFLFMTKVLIGLLIEVPYDLIVYGMVPLVPLIINLLAPPLFLAANTLTVRTPNSRNKRAVVDYVDDILYGTNPLKPLRRKKVEGNAMFSTIYIFIAFIIFAIFSFILFKLEFNIVQGGIFFIFFSTAMFLGYRLSLQVRELELVRQDHGMLALLRDFVYTPFIYIGRNISYRFSQLNIVSQILDTLVELPLKTFLKLVRQWINFLNTRKDDLL